MKHFVLICFVTIALTGCARTQNEMTANRSEMVARPTGLRTVVGCLSKTGETYVITGGRGFEAIPYSIRRCVISERQDLIIR